MKAEEEAMTAVTSKQIVARFMEALSAGDVDRAMDYFADGMTWETINWKRPDLQSKEEKRTSFTAILSTFPEHDFKIWPTSMVAEGDRIAVEAESSGTALPGKIYRNRYHFLFRIENDRIEQVKEYCDTDYAGAFWQGIR